jgi:hypothetical protein
MTTEGLEEKIKHVEKVAQRALDVLEIQNVVGKYAYFHMAGEEEKKYELFARKAPDVRVYFGEQGYWEGPDAPERAWGRRFGGDSEEDHGKPRVGMMPLHAPVTPVVEVAGDGNTAKGVWIGLGLSATVDKETGEPCCSWSIGKYGIDFIKEDGKWKIWHHHIYRLIRGLGWDEKWSDQFKKPEPVFPPGPKPDGPAVDDNPYRPDTVQRLVPAPPEPYETFDPKNMY